MSVEYRRLERYLERLPAGIDSYPHDVVKAATFIDAMSDRPVPVDVIPLPAPLEKLILAPPTRGAWIPEVHMVSLFKMIGDHHFEGRGGTEAFLQWVYEQNRALLSGRMYRVLFWVVRPESVFYGIEKRWRAFRRGTRLRIPERRSGFATIEVEYQPCLLDEEALLAMGTALRAAAEAAGAREVELELDDVGESRGRFHIRWVD